MSFFGNRDFGLEAAKGAVTGHFFIHKFGFNSDIDTSTIADIWEFGAVGGNLEYDFPTSDEIIYLSSSDGGDSGASYTVTVEGLDQYWAPQIIEDVQLDGQTPVQVGSGESWIRVNRMYTNGTTATAGNVYAANTATGTAGNSGVPTSSATVRAYYTISGQQTQQAIYSIPINVIGYMTNWWTSIIASLVVAQTLTAEIHIREFGGVFRVKQTVGLSSVSGGWRYHWDVPMPAPEKSDILVHVHDASANSMQVAAGFDVILVDN